jgi:hypothetical protein
VLVQQPERAAEQVDARGDDRRPQVVVLEDQQLDQVVEMALVIGDVADTPRVEGLPEVRKALR